MSNANLRRLRAAHAWQHDRGPQPGYVDLRMLEKKKLLVIYRRWRMENEPPYTVVLTAKGLDALGVDPFTGKPRPQDPTASAWMN